MPSLLAKVDSGTSKQSIQPKTWTLVKFEGKTAFKIAADAVTIWAVILRTEYPDTGAPTILRGRFVRYPGTSKADETGHDDKAVTQFRGGSYHSHWMHYFTTTKTMPVGFMVWHDGQKPITLDGRQIKAQSL